MSYLTELVLKDDLLSLSDIHRLPGELRDQHDHGQNAALLGRQAATESAARTYPARLPFALDQAKGVYLKDVDGNVYYDCLAGAGALALGHNHEVVQQAIRSQLDNNLPMQTLDISTPVRDQFVTDIFSCLPLAFATNAKIHFCGPSGTDAVEAAIKLVKIATGRRSMIAFQGGYHGATNASLSMIGDLNSKSLVPGLMPDVHFVPFPYSYRNPMGGADIDCDEMCISYIENVLQDIQSGVTRPAGVIIEAIQGEGGKIPASARFLQRLRKITGELGIPLILDEVQTGLGRTGKMFAFEHADIIPDVIVLSKAIGGSQPLAVILYHKNLDKWTPGTHPGTFRGNQLAMATGSATINYIRQYDMLSHVAEMGALFIKNLTAIQAETNCIGDIRGKGLMLGVEIINWMSGRKQSGNPERFEKLSMLIQAACFRRGLIIEIGGRQSSVLRFLPPLIINEHQTNDVCRIFKEAVIDAEAVVSSISPYPSG